MAKVNVKLVMELLSKNMSLFKEICVILNLNTRRILSCLQI